ncbi:MAG: hypothetical protein ABIT20_02340 [Gemmatimonadaceae bacterium]
MTSIPLHGMPRWRTVAAAQIRAVGVFSRKGGIALIGLLLLALGLVVRGALQARDLDRLRVAHHPNAFLGPQSSIVFALVAALYAFAMWQDEEPNRRSYHWMMPVTPHVNTLTKVLAGWVWILAASALAVLGMVSMRALTAMITGHPAYDAVAGWMWIVPLMSATIAYALVSSATVGTRKPMLWVAAVILAYSGVLLALDVLGYRDTHQVVRTAFTGEYGISAVLFGDIDRLETERLRMIPSVNRWLGASALWGGMAVLLLVATSYRRPEPSIRGEHGPLRRAVAGHAWLVASVMVIFVAAGLIATRVMKPEYEARVTIWNEPRPTEAMAMATSSARTPITGEPLALLRSSRIADSVVHRLALYVRPDNAADTSLLRNFSVADRFVPAEYRLAVNDRGARWSLRAVDIQLSDSGAVGDSVGRVFGLRWQPEAAILAQFAGREVGFVVGTRRSAAAELFARLSIVQLASGNFLQLALSDPDPHRAARALNALTSAYVEEMHRRGITRSVLDSAVAPALPYKNSPAQLFGVWLVAGVGVSIAVAFGANVFERLMRRL